MHGARIAWVRRGGLSIGGSDFLILVAHMPGEMILDILRADEAMIGWIVVMIILLGVGALTLHRHDIHRVLIWIVFGWFVLGVLLLDYRGGYL